MVKAVVLSAAPAAVALGGHAVSADATADTGVASQPVSRGLTRTRGDSEIQGGLATCTDYSVSLGRDGFGFTIRKTDLSVGFADSKTQVRGGWTKPFDL